MLLALCQIALKHSLSGKHIQNYWDKKPAMIDRSELLYPNHAKIRDTSLRSLNSFRAAILQIVQKQFALLHALCQCDPKSKGHRPVRRELMDRSDQKQPFCAMSCAPQMHP